MIYDPTRTPADVMRDFLPGLMCVCLCLSLCLRSTWVLNTPQYIIHTTGILERTKRISGPSGSYLVGWYLYWSDICRYPYPSTFFTVPGTVVLTY